jgi:hypothetical protein
VCPRLSRHGCWCRSTILIRPIVSMSPQQGQSEGCGYPDLDHQAVTLVAYGMGDLIQETGHRYGDTNAAKGTVAAQEHDGSHGNCDQQPGGPQLFL